MCGIAGIVKNSSSGGEWANNLNKVTEAINSLQHRGPDGTAVHGDMGVTFGMCRLAIIDLPGGKQPTFSRDRQVFSVFNGEIYNYRELRELLLGLGHRLETQSETECIPLLYLQFGERFVEKIKGMFAIAIWDKKKNKCVLVRDRFGEKPLWYSASKASIAFASEVKAFRALGVSLEPNYSAVMQYLQFGYISAPNSAFKQIKQVRPGHMVIYEGGEVREKRYWNIRDVPEFSGSYEEALEVGVNLLSKSVTKQQVSERPLGLFLSGGIDSSLIAAILAKSSTEKPRTFTIGFTNSDFDETSKAKTIADYLGLQNSVHVVLPDPKEMFAELSKVLDIPFADSSLIPMLELAKFARNDIVVALGGDGGDEVFGGYDRYRYSLLLNKARFLFACLPADKITNTLRLNHRFEKLFWGMSQDSLRDIYLSMQTLIQGSELISLASKKLDFEEELQEINRIWITIEGGDELRSLQMFDLQTYLPGDLMFKSDIASMAYGLELRSPFLDQEVVEFGISLPRSFKLKRGRGKRISRDILERFIPRSLFKGPKKGFAIPRGEWLRGPLRDVRNDLILNTSSNFVGSFDRRVLAKILTEHDLGHDRDRIIWPIMMWELWERKWAKS